MTSTLTPPANGRIRKNLASQLDRLDQILDGLADGLNEAVAGAVREALQAVLAELLPKLELLAQAQAAAPAAAVQQPAAAADAVRQWLGRTGPRVRARLRVLGGSWLAHAA